MAEWQSVMTQPEFLAWQAFYSLSPFDDYARYYRPAALVTSFAGGLKGEGLDDLLGWLERRQTADYSDADMNTMRAFGVKPPRIN